MWQMCGATRSQILRKQSSGRLDKYAGRGKGSENCAFRWNCISKSDPFQLSHSKLWLFPDWSFVISKLFMSLTKSYQSSVIRMTISYTQTNVLPFLVQDIAKGIRRHTSTHIDLLSSMGVSPCPVHVATHIVSHTYPC